MKCSLGISHFLEEISSLSHSIGFLFALIAEEGFLISPGYSLELCIQMGISFLFSFAFQFSSVIQSCLTLCDPMNGSTPGLPVHHHLPEFTQTHVHWVGDAIQPSHPLLSPSPPAPNLFQLQGLFNWVSSLHQVAKVLEFQLHQSFQWTPRTYLP